TNVEYVNGDPKQGALISIENAAQMAMPVIVEYTTISGKTGRKTLPVEIWQNNDAWTFKVDTQEALRKVVIDPDHVFPDIDNTNNTWAK
ncbi:MAG TPA: M1 family peptidase, partial [Agriterribacter sp.]|nr:M1 family peptidase [Agriterribacter sp.]